jgi:hypothetical protein
MTDVRITVVNDMGLIETFSFGVLIVYLKNNM